MIYAEVYGTTIELGSEDAAFTEFFARNYKVFLAEPSAYPDIKVRFGAGAGAKAKTRKEGMNRLGMGIHFDETGLYWENEFGFVVLVNQEGDGLTVNTYHFDLERETDPDLHARNYQRSLRWAVHFPLFVLLAQRAKLRLAHASAVARYGKAIAFFGLNKVGKSTLSAFLCQHDNYRLMTDNFLLMDEASLFGFPEVQRLDRPSLDRLGIDGGHLPTVYGKHHLEAEPEKVCLEAEPSVFFLVVNGPHLLAEPIEADQATAVLAGLHSYLGEFPAHSYLAALPLLPGFSAAAETSASGLLGQRPWYQLSLPRNWELGDVKELVEACI